MIKRSIDSKDHMELYHLKHKMRLLRKRAQKIRENEAIQKSLDLSSDELQDKKISIHDEDAISLSSENSLSLAHQDIDSFDSDSDSNQIQAYTKRYNE